MGNYYETFYPPFFMERRYAYNAIATNPKSWDRDDFEIVANFFERLREIEPLDATQVKAESHQQVLILKGEVANADIIKFLGRIADNILGVRAVDNRLTVMRSGATWAKPASEPSLIHTRPEQAVPTDQEPPISEHLI